MTDQPRWVKAALPGRKPISPPQSIQHWLDQGNAQLDAAEVPRFVNGETQLQDLWTRVTWVRHNTKLLEQVKK